MGKDAKDVSQHLYLHSLSHSRSLLCSSQKQVVQSKARRSPLDQLSLSPKMLCAICSYTPGANLHCLIPMYRARHSQTLLLSSSCLVPAQAEQQLLLPLADPSFLQCIPSFTSHLPKVQLQQHRRRLPPFCSLQDTVTFDTVHRCFIIQELELTAI